jgi:hypothetical protein
MISAEINVMRHLTADELNLISGGKDMASATAQSAQNLVALGLGLANVATGGIVAQVLVDLAVAKSL